MDVSGPHRPLGVYLHLPFCARKCAYCHFAIDPGMPSEARMQRYLGALTREIEGSPGGSTDTIYFGGGTPSLVPPPHIGDLIRRLRERYAVAADAEVTLEANPRDLDERGFAALREAGVNRLSLGVQSFDAAVLKEMFRDHTGDEAAQAARAARAAGFTNLSLDLILSQTFATSPTAANSSFYITGGGALFQLGQDVTARQKMMSIDHLLRLGPNAITFMNLSQSLRDN